MCGCCSPDGGSLIGSPSVARRLYTRAAEPGAVTPEGRIAMLRSTPMLNPISAAWNTVGRFEDYHLHISYVRATAARQFDLFGAAA